MDPLLMGIVEVPATRGKVAIIDAEDWPRVQEHSWHAFLANHSWYVATSNPDPSGPARLYLHRFLMGARPGVEVDHRDGDGLNNRRSNLRVATHQQNLANQRLSRANTSGYKGVCWFKRGQYWVTQTKYKGKQMHIGCFKDRVEAARAYDKKMRELHGEFARCNFT